MAQKVWLVKHQGANSVRNLAAYSLGTSGRGWVSPQAVHAFVKKNYAIDWLRQNNITHYEVIGVELPPSTQDARRSH